MKPLKLSMTAHLKILQYYMHTTEGIVMAHLLADTCISEFSLLAIQEPWQNPHIPTTYNTSNSAFHLLYPLSVEASVCSLVNKSLNFSSYTVCFPTPEHGNLQLRSSVEGMRDIMIHNVYRTRSISSTSTENLPPDEPVPLETHEIFHMSLLPFPTILLIMYCLGTLISIIPFGGDLEPCPIVLSSSFTLFYICTTSPYSYPLEL
jgi:hypothetical protein